MWPFKIVSDNIISNCGVIELNWLFSPYQDSSVPVKSKFDYVT